MHERIRKKILGTEERPRLNVYRSLNHIYVQLIDDHKGATLVSANSAEGKKGERRIGGNLAAAKAVGKAIAERAQAKGNFQSGIRSRRLPLPWADQGSGRCGARSRTEILKAVLSFRLSAFSKTWKRIV